MKVTKSYKIILLILAFIMSTMLALGMMKSPSAYASGDVVSATKYFNLNGATTVFTEEGLKIDAKKDVNVSFKNNLIVNDMSMKMKLPEGLTASINISLASFYVNGNPKEWSKYQTEGTEFDKTIKNTLALNYKYSSKAVVSMALNGKAIGDIQVIDGFITVNFAIKNNYLTVNDMDAMSIYSADEKIYYKVQNVDDRAVSSEISISFAEQEEGSGKSGDFILEYVDQKASDSSGDYKQSLKLADGQTKPESAKKQRVYLSESFYLRNSDGSYSLVVKAADKKYALSYKACSVLGDGAYLCLVNPNGEYNYDGVETSTSTPDTIRFEKNTAKFGVGIKQDGEPVLYEEFEVDDIKAFDFEDEQAPRYVNDQVAYASFLNALKEEYTTTNSQGETTSAGLGTSLSIPSMKDLVVDNFDSYASLDTKVYYKNDKTDSAESKMSFKLNAIGDYLFFVAFEDASGNKMNETDFVYQEDNDVKYGIYGENGDGVENYVGNFVFKFEIEDNADIMVKAPEIQGDGFKGVEYRASKFIIDADGCKDTYKLFYNKNTNASADDAGWIEIPAIATINEEDYVSNGFSYNEVKKVNFDGELKFLPTRIGAYKIECTVTSTVSSREASSSTIIKVESKASPVEVPSKWLENNIWSVVFLSIGTLSLIGIVILLCIKPKEQTDND